MASIENQADNATDQPPPYSSSFYSPSSTSNDFSQSMAVDNNQLAGSITAATNRERGRAAKYLDSKGFGWLLETEEEEEEQVPLL